MSDLVTFGETALRLSPPNHERLETATDVSLHAEGTESSAAVAATRLGAPTIWLSKLPDTVLGRRVVAELEQQGDNLQTQVVWDDDGRQGLRFVERGSAPRDDVTVQDRDDTALATVSTDDVRMATVQNADVFFVSGSTPALSPTARRTTEALFRAVDEGTRVFDLDFQPGLWSLEEAREALVSLQDSIDVLVANAGIKHGTSGAMPVHEESYDRFDDTVETNLRGVFAAVKETLGRMPETGRVLVPSGSIAVDARAGMGAYAVSKAAAEALVRQLAVDAEQTAAVVDPGLVNTDLSDGDGRDPDDVAEMFVWAAAEADPDSIDGERIDLRTWMRATRSR